MQVNGQITNTVSFSYELPQILSVVPQWLLSSNPTMYIEGSNFGPMFVNRIVQFHELNTTQIYVCPVVTWLAHSSVKCDFTNISLPLYSRFNITVSVEGQQNLPTDYAEFRTGFLNIPPVVPPRRAVMKEDELLFLEITGYDPNSEDTIQLFVASNPQFGTLFQITPAGTRGGLINASLAFVPVLNSQSRVLYIPLQNFFGNDSFQVFAIDDKGSQSPVQTIEIIVDAVPDPPFPRSAVVILDEDSSAVVNFYVEDPDQAGTENVTLTILSLPQYGSLLIQNGSENGSDWIQIVNVPFVLPANVTSATYRPLKDGSGSPYGTIVFKANDSDAESTVNGTIVLNVMPINDLPVFNKTSLYLSVFEDTPAIFEFNITDVDENDQLTVKIHNLSIAGSLYPFSQNLRDSDIIKSSPLGEGSEIKGPPYQLLFVPQRDVFTNANSLQSFDLSYSDRFSTFSDEISFEIIPVNDPPQISCGNPTVIELSTEFITNTSASPQ
ncbi:hypothetical protein BKA69DRAFT_819887 [Paraphysoderma sedebokerense]|nr:hypothetical protein BKA69DRAFT_819887 [Paraphysoderma sedebokerense]